jgi:predicted nucleic acid-binding protein
MIVLDTDIVTLLSYGRNERLRQHIEAAHESEELAITIITRMEIHQGRFESIVKAANEDELLTAMGRFRASDALLNSFRLLELNEAAARHFQGMTKAKKKVKMRRKDMLIACIALAHQAVLVTRNVDDFKPVAGLRVENWAD